MRKGGELGSRTASLYTLFRRGDHRPLSSQRRVGGAIESEAGADHFSGVPLSVAMGYRPRGAGQLCLLQTDPQYKDTKALLASRKLRSVATQDWIKGPTQISPQSKTRRVATVIRVMHHHNLID